MIDSVSLSEWDVLPGEQREQLANEVGVRDRRFRFSGLESHGLGVERHELAHFLGLGCEFILIVGSDAVLGYDRRNPFRPSEAQKHSFEETTEEYGIELHDYFDQCLSPFRRLTIAPFLLETGATDVGMEWGPLGLTSVGSKSYRQVTESLTREGLRLPTSDEWEYAERASSRTLFRRGDDCPADTYPAGDLTSDQQPFNLHRLPNAFGLDINKNPYHWECVAGLRRASAGATVAAQFAAAWDSFPDGCPLRRLTWGRGGREKGGGRGGGGGEKGERREGGGGREGRGRGGRGEGEGGGRRGGGGERGGGGKGRRRREGGEEGGGGGGGKGGGSGRRAV